MLKKQKGGLVTMVTTEEPIGELLVMLVGKMIGLGRVHFLLHEHPENLPSLVPCEDSPGSLESQQ